MTEPKPTAHAKIKITFRSAHELDAIANSLLPELRSSQGKRAHALRTLRKRTLQLNFDADGSAALRAIMSSYLRITTACINSCDAVAQLAKPDSKHANRANR
jgi:tRNA threonylcarbamoyladenosine modification (KEOPS) complex  Pcc1 subunit